MSALCKSVVIFVVLIFHFSFFIFHLSFLAEAQTMSNQDYIIKLQDLDTIPDDSLNSQSEPTRETLSSNISEGVNFKVKSGFGSTPPLPFSVSLSTDAINFGELVPTNSIIRTANLSINNSPLYGYSVISSQNHSLKNAQGATISNTTCDNGLCNQEQADEWINTLTYGFGYRCDNVIGTGCDTAFLQPTFYKYFADSSLSQSLQAVIKGEGLKDQEARISYKVNISGTQSKGVYLNTVTYIAVPNF